MERVMLVSEQIAEHFMRQMESNELKGGDKLPSETECMRRFDVSRGTVRKAFAFLIKSGYVRTEHGRGTFVVDNVLEVMARNGKNRFAKVTTRKVALVITESEFSVPILQGVTENIRKNKWELVVMKNNTLDEERVCIREILNRKDIDGMIIMPVRAKDERRTDFYSAVSHRSIPIVVIGTPPHGMLAASVLVDDAITVYSMVEEFHKKRCKNCIIFYESSEGEMAYSNRLRAYYIAMARYYSQRKPIVIDVDSENWTQEAEAVLREESEKIGIILFNCNNIKPLFASIERSGKLLRRDVAVIGYGPERDDPFPGLSVMEIPRYEIGRKSVELLFEQMIAGERDFIKNIVFAAKFLEGETS